MRLLLRSPLFPYTTLFRSVFGARFGLFALGAGRIHEEAAVEVGLGDLVRAGAFDFAFGRQAGDRDRRRAAEAFRSEEHTPELQSPYDVVCLRLLENVGDVV